MTKNSDINEVLVSRLRERMATMSLNPTSLGKKAGFSASVVRNIAEGKSKNPRSDTIAALAKVLEVTQPWLLGEEDKPFESAAASLPAVIPPLHVAPEPIFFDSRRPMPVYASAEGGDGALILSSDPIDYVPRPAIVSNVEKAFGVVIEGESMVRSYRPGDVAWINPMLRERRDEDCIFRGFNEQTGEAKAVIKVLVSWTLEEWTVEQLNPPKRYQLSRHEWPECFRVVGSTKRP